MGVGIVKVASYVIRVVRTLTMHCSVNEWRVGLLWVVCSYRSISGTCTVAQVRANGIGPFVMVEGTEVVKVSIFVTRVSARI